MKIDETIGLDYEREYYRLNDEICEKLEEQKEKFEKEKTKLEKELQFYKEIIKSILNIKS